MTRVELLRSLASRLAAPGERISMADHAAIRRMDSAAPASAARAVYSLLADVGMPLDEADDIDRWILLVHALALARGAHDPSVFIGDALIKIHFGEARLQQLLSADRALLADLVPRLARRLSSQQQRMDFAPLMRLLMAVDRDTEEAEAARLAIARSFVVANQKQNQSRKTV